MSGSEVCGWIHLLDLSKRGVDAYVSVTELSIWVSRSLHAMAWLWPCCITSRDPTLNRLYQYLSLLL